MTMGPMIEVSPCTEVCAATLIGGSLFVPETDMKKGALSGDSTPETHSSDESRASSNLTEKLAVIGKRRWRARKVVVHEDQHLFAQSFPGESDTVRAAFHCCYTLSKTRASMEGFLLVTEKTVRFVEEAKDGARITFKFSALVSLEKVGRRVKVYTNDGKVHAFSEINCEVQFASSCSSMEDVPLQSPATIVMNWIDHLWRKTGRTPAPASVRYSPESIDESV